MRIDEIETRKTYKDSPKVYCNEKAKVEDSMHREDENEEVVSETL